MNGFRIVSPVDKINIGKEWINSTSFKSRGEIVDDKGNKPSANYSGKRYRLIAEKERKFSCSERLGRGFLGVLIIVCSLGITLFSELIRDLFTKRHESIRFGIDLDPFFSQPKEIHFNILSYLNSADLGRCLGVSKKWQMLTDKDALWKALPAPEIAFGKKQWETYWGNIGEEPSLSRDTYKILKSPCPIWPGKKVEETHALVLVPEMINGQRLNLINILSLKEGHRLVFQIGAVEWWNKPKTYFKTHWILITKDILPESRNKSYVEQKNLIIKLAEKTKMAYEIPRLLDGVIHMSTKYVSSREFLFGSKDLPTFTRCHDEFRDYQTVVGGNHALNSLIIDRDIGFNSADVGVVALRRL